MDDRKTQQAKRHCMLVHAYYPVGETRVQRQALALVKKGFQVDVVCLRHADEAAYQVEDGVHIYRLPMKRYRGGGFFLQFLEYLAFFALACLKLAPLHVRNRYGVVQVHNLPDFLVFAAIFPRLFGARLILDLHDLMPEFFAARSGRSMSSLLVRAVILQEQLACRFAHRVITVTDIWKETLIKRGVPAEKVSVVMNVADPDIFSRRDGAARDMAQNGSLTLVYHGTFTHRYGVDLILQALHEIRPSAPDTHLMLLGGGDYRDELEQMVVDLDLKDNVTISERMLSAAELPALLNRADIGIVPNRSNIFTDGLLPTKLMEYVALGIPVIAARTPTIAAYFDASMVAFFEPGHAEQLAQRILTLHDDRQQRVQLAQNADRFNSKYGWEKLSEAYVCVVERMHEHSARLQPSW